MSDKSQVKPDDTPVTPGAPTSVEHTQPDDQYTTRGQHQDQKSVLKKSVQEGQRTPPVAESPGLHRTGSHTGTTGGPEHTESDPAKK
jgi:hypothetical protein